MYFLRINLLEMHNYRQELWSRRLNAVDISLMLEHLGYDDQNKNFKLKFARFAKNNSQFVDNELCILLWKSGWY